MATEALKSAAITNMDATPPVLSNARLTGAVPRSALATIEATAKDAGSTYRMIRVPSNAFGIKVEIATDDLGTTATLNVGVYQTAANGGAVVDADFFASAVDANAAAVSRTIVSHESGVYGIEDIEKPLWEALGLSADPMRDYDIAVTSVGAIDAAGTISMWVEYNQ